MSQTIFLKNPAYIVGSFSVAGKREKQGPLGTTFNITEEDEYFGQNTHERAECEMFKMALEGAIGDSKISEDKIEVMLAGDLLNQITSSSFAARDFDIPFIGLYGACSTMALSLAVGSLLVSGGFVKNAVLASGSHFGTAERQYRMPLELGSTRPPTAQWTATGVGATVLSDGAVKGSPRITAVTFGKVVDWGEVDVNNMGSAMAPATADTITRHLRGTKTKPEDYDAIYTGDLGILGSKILRKLLKDEKINISKVHRDCGEMLYSEKQNRTQWQGASGCGCSAIVLNGYIMGKLQRGEYKKILFVATGALLSPVSSFQGNTIPGIAHAVVIEG
ncbi:MAG: stage V sporulation protein AD [Firmicutes bacterium]|nr:stage V sporulation protein AD [Bacillota bacterium]